MSAYGKVAMMVSVAALMSAPAANAIDFKLGPLKANLRLQADVQGATFDDPTRPTKDTENNVDWTVRLNLEHIFASGIVAGARIEVDQDFDIDSDPDARNNGIQRDEVYGYLSTQWGRFEIGEQDGPADTLSFHAPIFGTGQVKGDFSRYASARARLSPFDSQDAFKVVYISPPISGFRFGASYGPKLENNENDPNPLLRTIQRDHIELGAQYQTLVGPFAWSFSGAYVTAQADPITRRQDIESWSIGSQVRWHKLKIGGAYVSRGNSNTLAINRNEKEVNVGFSWNADRWVAGASYARITRTGRNRDLFGVGTSVDIGKYVFFRVDGVYFNESSTLLPSQDGFVLLADMRIRL